MSNAEATQEIQSIYNVDKYTETYTEYQLPDPEIDTSFKSYMDYRKITDVTSDQWKLQQEAHTDEQGFRRVGDDYCVAMGVYYSESCGDRFQITVEDEIVFTVIVSDIKHPEQTDDNNMFHPINESAGNVLEFVVDVDIMEDWALRLGDVSALGFEGRIVKIERIE